MSFVIVNEYNKQLSKIRYSEQSDAVDEIARIKVLYAEVAEKFKGAAQKQHDWEKPTQSDRALACELVCYLKARVIYLPAQEDSVTPAWRDE